MLVLVFCKVTFPELCQPLGPFSLTSAVASHIGTAVNKSNQSWQQAELGLSRGGLGLQYISCLSPMAIIASLSSSGISKSSQRHLKQAVETFNCIVPTSDEVCVDNMLTSLIHQKVLYPTCVPCVQVVCSIPLAIMHSPGKWGW